MSSIPVDHGHAAAAGHVRHAAAQPSGRIAAVDHGFGEVPATAERKYFVTQLKIFVADCAHLGDMINTLSRLGNLPVLSLL